MITKTQLEKLAEISMLRFTDEEYKKLAADIDAALKSVEIITKTNTDAPMYGAPVGLDTLTDDAPRVGLSIEEALKNAPRKRGRYIVVPQVFE